MSRARISTTVDAGVLDRARRLLPGSDSTLLDQALATLIERLQEDRELAALAAHPYEEDPDLAWEAPAGPDLPYDGEIPAEVMRLALKRRRESA